MNFSNLWLICYLRDSIQNKNYNLIFNKVVLLIDWGVK